MNLQALLSLQKEMREKFAEMRKAKEQEKQKLIEETKQLEREYHQSQNQLVREKALLEKLRAETNKKMQLQRDERQARDAEERILDCQIRTRIQNIFDRVTDHHKSVSNITDPILQLDMIRDMHRLAAAVVQHSDNAEPRRRRTKTKRN